MRPDESRDLAREVLATLADASAVQLRTFAAGLALAGGPVALFANPVDCYADVIEFEEVGDGLAEVTMWYALRQAAYDGSLLLTLTDARQPFWQAVSAAMLEFAEDQLPARAARDATSARRR